VGNGLYWNPPFRFDFVRTELVYVPNHQRRNYVDRLLNHFVADRGRLIICSYGSSKLEGIRSEPLLDELNTWGFESEGVKDVISEQYGFVITRVVWLSRPWP
jgi:hypothetical protein